MPLMDGCEAVRSLRANPESKDIPIPAATALFHESDLNTCIEQGCNGYINKPFTIVELKRRWPNSFTKRSSVVGAAAHGKEGRGDLCCKDHLYSLSTKSDLSISVSTELSIRDSGLAALAPG